MPIASIWNGSAWVEIQAAAAAHTHPGTDVAWASYTPTLTASTTSPTLGVASVITGFWERTGRTVRGRVNIVFGTSGVVAGSGTYRVLLPVAPEPAASATTQIPIGVGYLIDQGSGLLKLCVLRVNTTGTYAEMMVHDVGGSAVTDAAPWTWAANDRLHLSFEYEADAAA
jgi:hypothetical protein